MVSKELIAASTRPMVLAVLAKGEDYGYSIIQRVKEFSGGTLEWSGGMLNPVLHRLERQKLIVSRWKTSDNGRRRKYYPLSANGTKAIAKEKRQWFAVHQSLANVWGANLCSI